MSNVTQTGAVGEVVVTQTGQEAAVTVVTARGPAGSEASVTNANVNAAIDDDPAATRAALELGSAALADTGTGASNVILGNDARLTDARTPTAHASSHVTGGTDKIRDASAAQDGLMTTTFAAKLNGIEAGADVTDATNVNAAGAVMESDYTPSHSILVQQSGTGSPSSLQVGNNTLVGRLSGGGSAINDLSASQVRTLLNVEDGADVTDAANVASTINGATAKTTLVDADETVLTDSAASFGLKKVTFANVFAYILTKLEAAASIVFTGQLRSTNQTAATSDALMTRDLSDTRYHKTAVLDAEVSFVSTTTFTDIPMTASKNPDGIAFLGFTVEANAQYSFTAILDCYEEANPRNQKFRLSIPTGTVYSICLQATGVGTSNTYHFGTIQNQDLLNALSTGSFGGMVIIQAVIRTGANAGNIILRAAQTASSATGFTIRAGSSVSISKKA
jgi:hypothetical protein